MSASIARLSMNQATTKYADMPEFLGLCDEFGVRKVGLWREQALAYGLDATNEMVRRYDLEVVGYYRTVPFLHEDPKLREQAINENKRIIAEAGELGAKMVACVVGGLPEGSKDLVGARNQVRDTLAEFASSAAQANTVIGLEPLNPIFCADRSVVSTLDQALEYVSIDPENIGVIVDTYHVWWDPDLQAKITKLMNAGAFLTYQICDWLLPVPQDNLLGRGYVGSGYIDFPTITNWVLESGYAEEIEVEIFNADVWASPPREVFNRVLSDYRDLAAKVKSLQDEEVVK